MTTRGQNLKRRLRVGEVPIGARISFAESAVAEIMAGTGFDRILIDTEHAPFSPEGVQTVLMASGRAWRAPELGVAVRSELVRALTPPAPS